MKKKKIKKLKKKKKKNPRTTARLYLKRRIAYSILCVDRTLPSRNKKSPIDFHDVRSTLASDKSAKRIFGAKRSLRERNCELRLCRVGCDFRAFFSVLSFFFFFFFAATVTPSDYFRAAFKEWSNIFTHAGWKSNKVTSRTS